MPLGSLSLVVASTLALSPFSTPWTVRSAEGGAWPTSSASPGSSAPPPSSAPPASAQPSSEPTQDPSWDEPDEGAPGEPTEGAEPTEGVEGAPTTDTVVPPAVVPPPVVPGPMVVTRPAPPTGLGLMISAGVTGGLAWVTVFARLGALNGCKSAIGAAVIDSGRGGVGAFSACLQSAGSMVSLTPLGWLLNDATYGLAPAAGVFRGRYDGTRAAWDGAPKRNAPVFVGVGAGLLAAGIVGRITTFAVFFRQLNPERLFNNYPLSAHLVLTQLSAASIQAGGGLLGYGLAYKKAFTNEGSRRKAAGLANLELTPQVGWAYSGLALSGRF